LNKIVLKVSVGVVGALCIVAGADLAMSRMVTEAIRAHLNSMHRSSAEKSVTEEGPVDVPSGNDERTQSDNTTAPAPESLIGISRQKIERALGVPFWAGKSLDYFKSEDGTLRRLSYSHGTLVKVEVVGRKEDHERDRQKYAPLGTTWDWLRESWGPPDFCAAGEWCYAARDHVAGVRVLFMQGVVVGNEDLPWDWIPPEED